MTWVCEMCSSTNTDSEKVCFVCDSPRSSKEIKASRIEGRRKKVSAAETRVSRVAGKLPVYLAYAVGAAIVMLLIVVILALIIYYQTGALDVVMNNCSQVFSHFGGECKGIAQNIKMTAAGTSNDSYSLGKNISMSMKQISNNMSEVTQQIGFVIRKVLY